MILSSAEKAALDKGLHRRGVFFRLDTVPVVRLWLGIGDIEPGVDAIDATGATYRGFGEITEIPEVSMLINGQAERVEFTLSGVSAEILQIASEQDAPLVQGADVALGYAIMDQDWQLLGGIKWVRRYTADFLAISQQPTEDPSQPFMRVIRLSVGSIMTGRRRPGLSFFTNADQQARSPGDRFCERTPMYVQEVRKAWPRF